MYMEIFDIRNGIFDRKNMEFINVIRHNCTSDIVVIVLFIHVQKGIYGV